MAAKFLYQEIIDAIFQSLLNRGGSATNSQIKEDVIKIMELSDEDVSNEISTGQNELDVKLVISKTLMKINDVITNPSTGHWKIIGDYTKTKKIDSNQIFKSFYDLDPDYIDRIYDNYTAYDYDDYDYYDDDYYARLVKGREEAYVDDNKFIDSLIEKMMDITPRAFEKLVVDVLNKIGFNLEATPPMYDGGIDATGTYKPNEILSNLTIAVQCKRYSPGNYVPGPEIQKFRGALVGGNYDRGIFVTTTYFSTPAQKEGIENSSIKPGIELVNGHDFAELMFKYEIGYTKPMSDKYKRQANYKIDEDYFNQFDVESGD